MLVNVHSSWVMRPWRVVSSLGKIKSGKASQEMTEMHFEVNTNKEKHILKEYAKRRKLIFFSYILNGQSNF